MAIKFVKEKGVGNPVVDGDGDIVVENPLFGEAENGLLVLIGQGIKSGSLTSLERFARYQDAKQTHIMLMELTGGKELVVEKSNFKNGTDKSSFSRTLSRVLGKK